MASHKLYHFVFDWDVGKYVIYIVLYIMFSISMYLM